MASLQPQHRLLLEGVDPATQKALESDDEEFYGYISSSELRTITLMNILEVTSQKKKAMRKNMTLICLKTLCNQE